MVLRLNFYYERKPEQSRKCSWWVLAQCTVCVNGEATCSREKSIGKSKFPRIILNHSEINHRPNGNSKTFACIIKIYSPVECRVHIDAIKSSIGFWSCSIAAHYSQFRAFYFEYHRAFPAACSMCNMEAYIHLTIE